MAKYADYKIAKSFKEIVDDKDGSLFELFTMSNEGYTAKRYLCTARYGDKNRYGDGLNKERINITLYSKTKQLIGSWAISLENYTGNSLTSNTVTYYGEVWTLSRDVAYERCMGVVMRKITAMKKKALALHDAIYAL